MGPGAVNFPAVMAELREVQPLGDCTIQVLGMMRNKKQVKDTSGLQNWGCIGLA